MNKYIYVDSSVLPEYFEKVLEAKKLLESGKVKNISDATRMNGISRSTYYKYKDCVFDSTLTETRHNATFLLLLSHETGVLSKLLSLFSEINANILTISQSLPIGNVASVTLTVDMTKAISGVDEILSSAKQICGVEQIQLIAMQ